MWELFPWRRWKAAQFQSSIWTFTPWKLLKHIIFTEVSVIIFLITWRPYLNLKLFNTESFGFLKFKFNFFPLNVTFSSTYHFVFTLPRGHIELENVFMVMGFKCFRVISAFGHLHKFKLFSLEKCPQKVVFRMILKCVFRFYYFSKIGSLKVFCLFCYWYFGELYYRPFSYNGTYIHYCLFQVASWKQ